METLTEAEELAHSYAFNALLCGMAIISILGIIAEIWVMERVTKRMLVHQNTKLILIMHQIWLIIHCFARSLAHIYVIVAYRRNHNTPSLTECLIMRSLISLSFFFVLVSIPALVIERAIATKFSSKYEQFGKNVFIILTLLQIIVVFGSFIFLVFNKKFDGSEKMVYCTSLNRYNVSKGVIVLIFYAIINFISLLMFSLLLITNKRLYFKRTQTNLSHRYQIKENIASIQTILPLVVFQSISLTVFIVAVIVYIITNSEWSQKNFAIYLESVQLTPLYALIFPIVIIYTQRRVKNRTRDTFKTAMNFTATGAADHYFSVFKEKSNRTT